jgi:hypothetical protein
MNFNHFINGEGNSSFYINNFLIEYDIGLLSHFPCNTECKKSKTIGHSRYAFLKEELPKIANEFKNKLICQIHLNRKKLDFSILDKEFNYPIKNHKLEEYQIINFK